jgi:hypothetical protein
VTFYCGVREAHTPAAGEGEAEPYIETEDLMGM